MSRQYFPSTGLINHPADNAHTEIQTAYLSVFSSNVFQIFFPVLPPAFVNCFEECNKKMLSNIILSKYFCSIIY